MSQDETTKIPQREIYSQTSTFLLETYKAHLINVWFDMPKLHLYTFKKFFPKLCKSEWFTGERETQFYNILLL